MTNREYSNRCGKWEKVGEKAMICLDNCLEQFEAMGKLTRKEEAFKCTCCHKITLVDNSILYEFCPHCGAVMDESEEDE